VGALHVIRGLAAAALALVTLAPGRAFAEAACPRDPAQKATLDHAEELRAVGEYACAASELERLADTLPRSGDATSALGRAISIRLGLGDIASAQKDLDAFVKLLGADPGSSAVSLLLDVADALSRQARWPEVERFLSVRRALVEHGTSTQKVQFQQLMARSLARQGKQVSADAAYHRLVNYHPSLREETLEIGFSDDEASVRPPSPAYAAVAEARLHFADQLRDRALKLTLGKGDAASLRAKRSAVARAENAYLEVLASFACPPLTQAAVAGSLARIRSQLWAQTYLALGPSAADAEEKSAIEANRACVAKSGELQVASSRTRPCGAWLDRHRFQRFRALQELAPAPRRRGEAAAEAGEWAWRHPL
jgi:hypothetical protein